MAPTRGARTGRSCGFALDFGIRHAQDLIGDPVGFLLVSVIRSGDRELGLNDSRTPRAASAASASWLASDAGCLRKRTIDRDGPVLFSKTWTSISAMPVSSKRHLYCLTYHYRFLLTDLFVVDKTCAPALLCRLTVSSAQMLLIRVPVVLESAAHAVCHHILAAVALWRKFLLEDGGNPVFITAGCLP